jgi:hypothetical protein
MAEKLGGRRSDNRRPPHSRLEGLNPGRASNMSNTRGLSSQTHTQSAHLMADETKTIELRPCGLQHQADWILRFEGCSEHVDGSSRIRTARHENQGRLCNPGFTKTDLNDIKGIQPVEVGAATLLALLDEDGSTGGVFSKDGRDPW